jgi:hypothetical protein
MRRVHGPRRIHGPQEKSSMRKLVFTTLAAATLLVPTASHASGFFVGARAGYSIPGGNIQSGLSTKDLTQSMFPLQLDFGFAGLLDTVALGGYAGIGLTQLGTQLKDACAAQGASCDSKLWRVGAQANIHPALGLWGGVFLGWEQQTVSASYSGVSASQQLRGYETGIQGGWDFGAMGVKFGPYLSWSTGKFNTAVTAGGALPNSNLDLGTANHSWLTLGIRGVFGL